MSEQIVYAFAMMGTVVFALSGAMAASRKELDMFGFIVVGLMPAIGGGTVRDLLLGRDPIFWMADLNYVYVATAVSILAFFQVHRLDGKRYTLLTWADAFGLALFTVMGTQTALAFQVPAPVAIIMGVITGTFGGMLRDIICNEVPFLLQKEIYALAAIGGSLTYLVLIKVGFESDLAMILSVGATLAIRGPAIIFGWSLPPYRPDPKKQPLSGSKFKMKLVAFAASNSTTSMNKALATYAASKVDGAELEILDLNDFELPIFSPERENELGQPALAVEFSQKLANADAIIVSFAEHNGNYTAAYKNLIDWCTRIDRKVYQDKPLLMMAASPGGRGGQSVLELAQSQQPRFGGNLKATFSLPNFNDNFDRDSAKITDPDLEEALSEAVAKLTA